MKIENGKIRITDDERAWLAFFVEKMDKDPTNENLDYNKCLRECYDRFSSGFVPAEIHHRLFSYPNSIGILAIHLINPKSKWLEDVDKLISVINREIIGTKGHFVITMNDFTNKSGLDPKRIGRALAIINDTRIYAASCDYSDIGVQNFKVGSDRVNIENTIRYKNHHQIIDDIIKGLVHDKEKVENERWERKAAAFWQKMAIYFAILSSISSILVPLLLYQCQKNDVQKMEIIERNPKK